MEILSKVGDWLINVLFWISLVVIGLFITVGVFSANHPNHPPRRAVESAVRADLELIRRGIWLFHLDTGVYPATLRDLNVPNEQALVTRVKKGTYEGPYAITTSGTIAKTGLPKNDFLQNQHDPNIAHHWRYDPKTGEVRSAVDGKTTDGKPYSSL